MMKKEECMETDELVYRKLQKHIDRMPVGFPESKNGSEIKILKDLFTPEEAQIALELSMLPETAERIYPRVKKFIGSVEELELKLDGMYRKGLIIGGKRVPGDNGEKKYSNDQFIVGIFEMQVNRVNKGITLNTVRYTMNDFYKEFSKTGVPVQMRTIPIGKGIIRENFTDTYDNIRAIVQNTSDQIVIINCICRQLMDTIGMSCRLSDLRETCVTLGDTAQSFLEKGIGRVISKDDMFSLLEKFEEKGFVVQPENNRKPEFVCFCCGCCCGVLNMIKKFPKPAEMYESNYYASVDADTCAGCGTCTKRCQMGAISMQDEKAVVDINRCIGCGLCTSTCKTGSAVLNKKEKTVTPPADHEALYKKILMKKIGAYGIFKTSLKHKLGFKV